MACCSLFWVMSCLLCWYSSALLMRATWYSCENNAISFAVETTYGGWTTAFPAVLVCETGRSGLTSNSLDLEEVLREIAHFRGFDTFIRQTCFQNDQFDSSAGCPRDNLAAIASKYRTPCSGVFVGCTWNTRPVNCCELFWPLQTEIGACLAVNSIHTGRSRQQFLSSNYSTGPGRLALQLAVDSDVFILPNQEVPHASTSESDVLHTALGTVMQRWVSVHEVENAADVTDVAVARRGCRFPTEGVLTVYDRYSQSACVTECRKQEQLRLCGCCTHQTPGLNDSKTCDLPGLACVASHRVSLSVFGHSRKHALVCRCIMGCEDQDIDNVYSAMRKAEGNRTAMVEISMIGLPTERFKRNVVRGKLDLVVSMGATAALFVGASMLSAAELVYHFTVRLWHTARAQRRA